MHGITRAWLYRYWPQVSFFAAFFIAAPLLAFHGVMSPALLAVWLQTPVYLLHQFEEHGTGAFKRWINLRVLRSGGKELFTDAHIFWINVPLTWILFPLSAILAGVNPVFGVWVVMVSVGNSLLHVAAAVALRQYNPGFLASLFLNLPAGIAALYFLNREGVLNPITVTAGVLAAVVLHALIQAFVRSLKKNGRPDR